MSLSTKTQQKTQTLWCLSAKAHKNLEKTHSRQHEQLKNPRAFIKTSVGSFGVFDNPDLVPERSWNIEAGIRQGYKFGGFMGYLDVAVFRQKYINTIEYLFGFWDPSFALAGFKFLNTGRSQVDGVDISMAGMISLKKQSKIQYTIGYNYILPKTLEPDLVFANDVFEEF